MFTISALVLVFQFPVKVTEVNGIVYKFTGLRDDMPIMYFSAKISPNKIVNVSSKYKYSISTGDNVVLLKKQSIVGSENYELLSFTP